MFQLNMSKGMAMKKQILVLPIFLMAFFVFSGCNSLPEAIEPWVPFLADDDPEPAGFGDSFESEFGSFDSQFENRFAGNDEENFEQQFGEFQNDFGNAFPASFVEE